MTGLADVARPVHVAGRRTWTVIEHHGLGEVDVQEFGVPSMASVTGHNRRAIGDCEVGWAFGDPLEERLPGCLGPLMVDALKRQRNV